MSYVSLPTVNPNEAVESDWGNQVKDNFESMPRGVLGYAQVTANQGSISSATNLTGLTTTVTVAAGRRIRVTGKVQLASANVGADFGVAIMESTTQLSRIARLDVATDHTRVIDQASVVLTPSAGSHTYHLRAVINAAGTVGLEATSDNPSFILVEDIGPA